MTPAKQPASQVRIQINKQVWVVVYDTEGKPLWCAEEREDIAKALTADVPVDEWGLPKVAD